MHNRAGVHVDDADAIVSQLCNVQPSRGPIERHVVDATAYVAKRTFAIKPEGLGMSGGDAP
jgi:hypothetical protein